MECNVEIPAAADRPFCHCITAVACLSTNRRRRGIFQPVLSRKGSHPKIPRCPGFGEHCGVVFQFYPGLAFRAHPVRLVANRQPANWTGSNIDDFNGLPAGKLDQTAFGRQLDCRRERLNRKVSNSFPRTKNMDTHISRPIVILLVEDNLGDIRLTREALKENKVRNAMDVVNDGVEALAFLRREGPHENAARPDLILLDLNLPKKGGLEVLAEIKADDALKSIPVVVLTTSQAEQDIVRSYNLYANAYVTKPVDLEQFIAVIKSIEDFWVEIVKLPPNGNK